MSDAVWSAVVAELECENDRLRGEVAELRQQIAGVEKAYKPGDYGPFYGCEVCRAPATVEYERHLLDGDFTTHRCDEHRLDRPRGFADATSSGITTTKGHW